MKNELNISFPSKLINVQISRAILIGFLSELDLPMSVINELKTALSEAVTNAIVHGYNNDEKKIVNLSFSYDDLSIKMIVEDKGIGIENIDAAKEPLFSTKFDEERAGLGFTIMEVFMDELKVRSIVGQKTEVEMIKKYHES
jgi:stage II sporulation protein AB (anti-sigma F factor)